MSTVAPPPNGLPPRWGYLGFAFYAVHASVLVANGEAPAILWSCHLASLLTGAGILWSLPRLVGVGIVFQVLGLPTWFAALVGGMNFHPTSALTHIGGFLLSVAAVRKTGVPRGTAWRGAAVISVLWIVSRVVVPPEVNEILNVNLSGRYWFGWEERYVSYYAYVLVMLGISTAIFLGVEALARFLRRRTS